MFPGIIYWSIMTSFWWMFMYVSELPFIRWPELVVLHLCVNLEWTRGTFADILIQCKFGHSEASPFQFCKYQGMAFHKWNDHRTYVLTSLFSYD